jgi:predicted transcriptional regulator
MLMVMECIRLMHEHGGALQIDMQFMCELNTYYLKNIVRILLERRLIYSTDSKPYRYYLTPLGRDTHKRVSSFLKETLNFTPKLNAPKVRRAATTRKRPS